SGDVAAEHAHHEAPFQSKVGGLIHIVGPHANQHSSAEDHRAHHGHQSSLGERTFLAHEHALKCGRTGQDTSQRCGHCQFYQQVHQMLFKHCPIPAPLRIIIMEIHASNLPMPLEIKVRKVAEADLPTRFGPFRIYGFEGSVDGETEEVAVL